VAREWKPVAIVREKNSEGIGSENRIDLYRVVDFECGWNVHEVSAFPFGASVATKVGETERYRGLVYNKCE